VTNREEHFMLRAIELSAENVRSGRGGPFGAVVVHDGRIIGEGANSVTSANDPTAHAEVVAIRHACRSLDRFHLEDCQIYATCEPCPMCLGAIYWARLSAIFFANTKADAASIGFDDSYIYEQLNRPIESRSIPMLQILRTEALRVFEDWQRKPDKVEY
jgi:tRNA(Arg) A34 adenosine deaminase TadA